MVLYNRHFVLFFQSFKLRVFLQSIIKFIFRRLSHFYLFSQMILQVSKSSKIYQAVCSFEITGSYTRILPFLLIYQGRTIKPSIKLNSPLIFNIYLIYSYLLFPTLVIFKTEWSYLFRRTILKNIYIYPTDRLSGLVASMSDY